VGPAIPHLKRLLRSAIVEQNEEVLLDILWTFTYLTEMDTGSCLDCVPFFIEHIKRGLPRVITPALRVVGNIATGNDVETEAVISAGFLECVPTLMACSKNGIRKETMWSVSNIAAGSCSQIQKIIDSGVLPTVIDAARVATFEVKKEAIFVLANMLEGSNQEQMKFMTENEVLVVLCETLPSMVETVLPTVFSSFLALLSVESLAPLVKIQLENVKETIEKLSLKDEIASDSAKKILEILQSDQ